MNNIEIIATLNDITKVTYILKIFFICICTYYTFLKTQNIQHFKNKNTIFLFLISFLVSTICGFINYKSNSLISTTVLVFLLSITYSFVSKLEIGKSILVTVLSLSINYVIFSIAIIISFIPNIIFSLQNDSINLIFMIIIHILVLNLLFRIRRFKNGFAFLQKKSQNEYFDILILNISIAILFSIIILANLNLLSISSIFFSFILFSAMMFITIQKSLQLYYKHKLLVTELEQTKKELESKNEEITKLEQENLNFSKKSHSIAHKQKALEYKLNQLIQNSEIASEIDISDRVKNLSNEISDNTVTTELSKTDIEQIDDMLKYMQSECVKNKIDFELKLNGNIHSMINNCISVEDLEILIADHIKNAIIAINNCENSNRSILVKLGWIDGFYGFHIYDTGIEFELDTLSNLGKKPMTTHADSGGTGMGFMNTFDTLNKYQASLVINEIGKPCTENYTKSLLFTFDNLHNFEIISYRNNN